MSRFIHGLLSKVEEVMSMAEDLYKDLHQHPELPMQEVRTSSIIACKLREAGFEVTEKVGATGVVGVMKNGEGPTVMLRADMDAVPMKEETGLDYASRVEVVNEKGETVPVAHSCGHDMHTAWLTGAATVLSLARDSWRGTLMTVFQPGA